MLFPVKLFPNFIKVKLTQDSNIPLEFDKFGVWNESKFKTVKFSQWPNILEASITL